MTDKKAINVLKKMLDPKASANRRSGKKSLSAEEREAVLAAIGVLGWTSLAESRIKSLAKSRKEKQDRDSTA